MALPLSAINLFLPVLHTQHPESISEFSVSISYAQFTLHNLAFLPISDSNCFCQCHQQLRSLYLTESYMAPGAADLPSTRKSPVSGACSMTFPGFSSTSQVILSPFPVSSSISVNLSNIPEFHLPSSDDS